MKKIAIIGAVGVPACYGGFETLAENLVKELSDKYDITVYCSTKSYKIRPKIWHRAKLKYIPLDANGLSCLPYDTIAAMDAIRYADVLLLLGLNAMCVLMFFKLFGSKKIIISNVDGLESTREKYNAVLKFYCRILERMAGRFSDAIVADNQVIKEHINNRYPGTFCRLIEYGADHCVARPMTTELLKQYPFLKTPYAFSVCRIEKENNVHITLEAFKRLRHNLVIVGNWNKNEYAKGLFSRYSQEENIHLLPPLYDLTILDPMRSNCRLYIHGHHCGGTNPSLVEAMNLGRPILAYDVNFNRETTENKALYYKSSDELCQLINTLDDNQIDKVGRSMAAIAQQRYTWKRIAGLYAELFDKNW